MIWRIVSKFAELAQAPPAVAPPAAYAVFDGLFQHALIRHLAGQAAPPGTWRRTCSSSWTP